MAEGFEPFHVPQQSRRDKLRVLQNNTTCEDAAVVAAATFQGCSGLLPLYDPSLLFNGTHGFHNQNNNPLDGEAVESCKENQTCAVKEEGVNLMGYVGGGFMNPSTSSSSHNPYLDPQSSLVMNPTSIQDINNNPFFYTTQNLRGDFDQPFNGGGEVVTFKPESLSLTRDSTTTGQGLSLSLSSQHTHHNNHPLELNLQRYGYAMFGDKGIGDYAIRGSTSNDVSRSSVPLGPFTGYASILKGSRFLKPAHQLLEELCDIGQGIYGERSCGNSNLMDPPAESLSGSGIVDDSLACTSDLGEHRRKKTRLISMLDEVYRRYKQYYQQMQAVVASFESVAGLGNAAPYTSFALNSMSKHFRSLKNAITDQLWFTSKALGEGSFEKDEAHRFGTTDPSLYHQKPLHNSHILEHQHVWRPQRGLPERAVAVLRAWLFEHFLHPYPTDTDKQMLAKQTGLSRSQVSNWFINARVRLWKPMVEEIHMLETRQAQKALEPENRNESSDPSSAKQISCDKPPQTIPTQKTQDPPSKRSRNEPPTTNFSYNLSSHHHVGIGANTAGGNHGVSLTLGLRQNNGIGLSEPFPMNIAHRFGLEANNEGYVMGGDFEAQNRQLLHDFVG